MLHAFWDWTKFGLGFGLACLVAGLIVTLPLLLFKPLRKRFSRSNYDVETIGAVALLGALLVIGLYNHFGANGV
ncbi:hypothetical protein [Rhodanobacter sp. OK091]|uniref:hypothetical protein n=1 Tax=Rhodanobacter sp. OK091 TaxID=1881037 RepID=UPI00091DBD4B|nr:hypothetical protein [Rhodanobacter sp. OK091]SHL71947.1 hypothetical protein SAMN05428972_0874 [Rhodanobacter sp. OK091]